MRSVRFFAALLAVSVVLAPAAWAQQTEVGTTAATNTNTTGTPPRMATRNLFIGTNVFFEERIETSKTGQAQLLFLDESALTIASNSDVVLDKFIYDPKTSKGELALSVGAGLFRFVGGRISKTSGVRIETPTAYIGIRGGIVIIKVEPGTGATRATFVFGKQMTVTNKKTGVTRKVTRPGFSVDVASLDDPPSTPFKELGANMAGYLTELEGRTGQTAGSDDPPTDKQVADSGINELGSSNPPEDIAGDTAATGGTDGGDPPLPTIPNLESEISSTNPSSDPVSSSAFGVATSRTLTGFSGGLFVQLDANDQFPVLKNASIFGNTNGNPADIEIITEAVGGTTSNGIVTASFDVMSSSHRLEAEFGGTGETSAFFNDDSFVAIATSATFDGSPLAIDAFGGALTTNDLAGLDSVPGLDSVEFCQCEFLQWGFWAGVLQPSEIIDDFVLAFWVAGEIPALVDMPILGTATYSGHAIGFEAFNGSPQAAIGGFSQTYDFATGSGSFSVTNFGFGEETYNGGVNAIFGQENLFTGSGSGTTTTRDISLNGAFFSGGGDPVAQVGGGFNISDGGTYEASGIFAADKQ